MFKALHDIDSIDANGLDIVTATRSAPSQVRSEIEVSVAKLWHREAAIDVFGHPGPLGQLLGAQVTADQGVAGNAQSTTDSCRL